MKITKVSKEFSPLCGGIFFEIDTEQNEPTSVTAEIVDVETGEVVATQHLREITAAKVNIAPYVKRFDEYAPTAPLQLTTFIEAPTASYRLRIGDIESEEVAVSVNRCDVLSLPTMISSLPLSRRIAHGENDEILIMAERGRTISAQIVTNTGESLHLEHLSTTGVATLVISTEDFDDDVRSLDITLYCDDDAFDSLSYKVMPTYKTYTRLAWISACGSIERYTFPIAYKSVRSVSKQVVATTEGATTTNCKTEYKVSLSSRFESQATIDALSQIVSSPMVWIEQNGELERVGIASSVIEQDLFGSPSHISIDVCLRQREVSL